MASEGGNWQEKLFFLNRMPSSHGLDDESRLSASKGCPVKSAVKFRERVSQASRQASAVIDERKVAALDPDLDEHLIRLFVSG